LAVGTHVILGVAGGEFGVRGFLKSYNADTGALEWTTYTTKEPDERDRGTWKGNSWMHGGSATWLTGSYDPELNLVYWGVGNPGPDLNGDVRPGDNLYTCSLLALNATDGTIKWHFQFTPHDTHDWDANQIPVLIDAPVNGRARRLVVTANRNGFYYVLDRVTGEFVAGTAY